MAVEILMPELGEGVHEGTVSRWLKAEGEYVKEDEPVVEIMTDKVNTELPSPASGILTKILIPEGGEVQVFKAMGLIEETDSAGTSAPTPTSSPAEPAAKKEEPKVEAPVVSAPKASDGSRAWYSPVVRSVAKQNNIDDATLATIAGSGVGGRVTKRDLEAFIARGGAGSAAAAKTTSAPQPTLEVKAPESAPISGDVEIVPLVGMRKMIADAMVRSSQVPTVSTVTQVDVTTMVNFRTANKDSFQSQFGVKLTYTPFFIKAITEALLENPLMNSSLQDGKIYKNKAVHMGVAVALGKNGDEGLIVPVIRNCESKSLIDVAKDLEEIAKKARNNQLSVADVQGGTFTLTNPGTYGALFGTPMINAPQAGILGTYGIQQVPMIIDGMIAIRSVMHLVLTYDHRLIDGLVAGKFLASVRDKLQKFDFFR
jgi:pyruvate/2-oxoglutarate dehydrogenase complex dihydrolipoamide acyltransferase (E2) component